MTPRPRNPTDAPSCHGRRMVLRFGPRGAFYGCAAYPACRKTLPAKVQEPQWFQKQDTSTNQGSGQ